MLASFRPGHRLAMPLLEQMRQVSRPLMGPEKSHDNLPAVAAFLAAQFFPDTSYRKIIAQMCAQFG